MQYSCESRIRTSRSSDTHQSCTSNSISSSSSSSGRDRHCSSRHSKFERLAGDNAVVVFTSSSCCMCHVVCKLFCNLGVNPAIHEIDDDEELQEALISLSLCNSSTIKGEQSSDLHSCPSSSPSCNVPAVFVGGKLLGGLDKVMAAHINGSLVPLLKDAGALWL